MKKSLILLMVFGLFVGTLATAGAAQKKPTKVKLFLHGTETVGEVDMANNFAAAYNRMDATEPSESVPRSREFVTWAGDPSLWNDCAGSFLVPNWSGAVSGQIKGNVKVTLYTVTGPRALNIQIWPDVVTQTCASNDVAEGEYPEPTGEITVDVPPGADSVEAVIKGVNFKAFSSVLLQVTPVGPMPGRILYDAPDFASSIEFTCTPTAKSCV
ncbi:MAG: hypothetical protein QOG54_391 [Actinomycetota bacterium]|jgi:hypothetical protein|nr:hypothetical protein [Actinomycetota bacterium]